MTQIATIERILDPTHAEIAVARQTACGHDCSECAGCGVTGAAVYARALNSIGAQPGQKVVVESSTRSMMGIILLVYMVPVALFFLGYFLTGALPEPGRYLTAALAFLAGLLPAVLYDRRLRRRGGLDFTVVRLF